MSYWPLLAIGACALLPFAAPTLLGVYEAIEERRLRRAALTADAEAKRMKDRLPPHPRCSCSRCVEWRARFAETLR